MHQLMRMRLSMRRNVDGLYCHNDIPLPSQDCIRDIRYAWRARKLKGARNTQYIRKLLHELRIWREINATKSCGIQIAQREQQ